MSGIWMGQLVAGLAGRQQTQQQQLHVVLRPRGLLQQQQGLAAAAAGPSAAVVQAGAPAGAVQACHWMPPPHLLPLLQLRRHLQLLRLVHLAQGQVLQGLMQGSGQLLLPGRRTRVLHAAPQELAVRLQEIRTARVRRAGATAGKPAGMASRQAAPAAWGVLEAQQQPQPVRAPGGATAGQAAGVGVLRSRQQRASKQQVTQQPPQLRRQQPVQLPRAC